MKKLILLLSAMFCLALPGSPAKAGDVYFIEVKSVITSATYEYVHKAINKAAADNATAFVIRLDTPGGLLDATRNIVQDILASPVPVVVYVAPAGARAASAGTFITLAANYAVMAEGTSIGAAHPVSISGEDIEGDMRSKTVNDTTSFIRSIAEKRNRNMDEAVLTVTESKSFTASEAMAAGLIDEILNSDAAVLQMLQTELGSDTPLVRVDIVPTITENIAFTLASPNILMLLLLVGIFMIFLEFKMPGTFVFAGLGIVALVLFMVGVNFIPVNLLGVLLVLVGIALLIAEIFVTSFGLLAVAGIAALAGGMRIMFNTDAAQGVAVSIWLLVIMVVAMAALVLLLGRVILKDRQRKPQLGMNNIIGKTAVVMQWEGNHGQVHVHGEIWSASSADEFKANDEVKVTGAKGMLLTVKSLKHEGATKLDNEGSAKSDDEGNSV